MKEQLHILNGDALREQLSFIPELNIIILREAFIEGPLNEIDFLKNRKHYFLETYPFVTEEFVNNVQEEISKIKKLTSEKEVVLWFEYDLFCQCNFWYACSEIKKLKGNYTVSWVHPLHKDWSGFGKVNKSELENIFKQRQKISPEELEIFASLWNNYQKGQSEKLIETANPLRQNFPKLEATIIAEVKRKDPKYLLNIAKKILNEVELVDFKSFFLAFTDKHGIYGFGDLQVKQLYDQVQAES